jgi:hypothetical protein
MQPDCPESHEFHRSTNNTTIRLNAVLGLGAMQITVIPSLEQPWSIRLVGLPRHRQGF